MSSVTSSQSTEWAAGVRGGEQAFSGDSRLDAIDLAVERWTESQLDHLEEVHESGADHDVVQLEVYEAPEWCEGADDPLDDDCECGENHSEVGPRLLGWSAKTLATVRVPLDDDGYPEQWEEVACG